MAESNVERDNKKTKTKAAADQSSRHLPNDPTSQCSPTLITSQRAREHAVTNKRQMMEPDAVCNTSALQKHAAIIKSTVM